MSQRPRSNSRPQGRSQGSPQGRDQKRSYSAAVFSGLLVATTVAVAANDVHVKMYIMWVIGLCVKV